MSKSPLALFNETAEQFNVTAEKQIHIRQKLAYIDEQVQSMQFLINRLLCDIVTTKLAATDAKDPTTLAAIEGKQREYERDLRQTSMALEHHLALQTELNDSFKQSGEEA